MIKTTARFILAFILWGVGGFGLLALLSYHSADSSLNTAGVGVANWMGSAGALTADLLIQLFGRMAFLLPLAFFVWGVWLCIQEMRLKGRFYALLVVLIVVVLCEVLLVSLKMIWFEWLT